MPFAELARVHAEVRVQVGSSRQCGVSGDTMLGGSDKEESSKEEGAGFFVILITSNAFLGYMGKLMLQFNI